MITLVILILCLYYWFVYSFEKKSLAPPPGTPTRITENNFDYFIDDSKSGIFHMVTTVGIWHFPLEADFYMSEKKIVEKNDCFQKPDGSKVPAKGEMLYRYAQTVTLKQSQNLFVKTADQVIQNNNIFYFVCKGNEIDHLESCRPGEYFSFSDLCTPINPCVKQNDGFLYPDLSNNRYYFKCLNGEPVKYNCPENTYFFASSCYSMNHLTNDCPFKEGKRIAMDAEYYFQCINNKMVITKCPQNTFFSPTSEKCESDVCVKQINGKIPLDDVFRGPFSFSPGYYLCKNGKVEKIVECPNDWDKYESKGDNLLHLPTVFDVRQDKCDIPSYCENVFPTSESIIVPVHEFTKHVHMWSNSHLFDRVAGYRCKGTEKTRVVVNEGNIIDNYTEIPGCKYPPSIEKIVYPSEKNKKIIIADKPNFYYNCADGKIDKCPGNQFFNGILCVDKIPNAHEYKNIGLFRFGHLNINNWMKPWEISSSRVVTCEKPEEVYLHGYNVCAHPDCAKYPFLMQVSFPILEPGFVTCIFKDGKITKNVKTDIVEGNEKLDYWRQRYTLGDPKDCVVGHKTESGNFIKDQAMYATCDTSQPFVFCPSSSTKGIDKTNLGTYACVPEDSVYKSVLRANKKIFLWKNEVETLVPKDKAIYRVNGNARIFNIRQNPDGIPVNTLDKKFSFLCNTETVIYHKVLVNHPLNTYYKDKVLKDKGNNYLLEQNGWTKRPLSLPKYTRKNINSLHKFHPIGTKNKDL